MCIFSQEDIERIRSRMSAEPAYLEHIEKDTADVRHKLYIQKSGIGTWYHYFTCPECGVRLTFDYDNNEYFCCPGCGAVVSGEPYLGAWWETVLCKTTSAAYKLAVAYVGTEERQYFEIARKILLEYADNYVNYEVHGGIPYNKPGRFLSQVLSDCEPICDLSRTYALMKNELSAEEREHVEQDLLRPAAEHQKNNLTPQLHNHEVAICTSIAAVGLAIGDESLVEFACNEKYGLKYQIDNAYLSDDLWFEGSAGYHNYSLIWFVRFEMMAKNTRFSLFADKHYAERLYRAMVFLKNIYVGNGNTVRLNDGSGSIVGNSEIYEYAYTYFEREELLPFLAACYADGSTRKGSLVALIYGADHIPEGIPELERKTYISPCGSNLAMLRGSDSRYLLFKALPYGGEHDHYDRLAVSFDAFGVGACIDFGTASGYGSPLHYGYFKNTATHNTVVIDGENMAPCDTVVNEYRVNADDDIYLDAETLPPEDYVMLDSFTIKQWSDEAYRGVRMRRIISWHDKYFIDVFAVKSDNSLRKEWTWHVDAVADIPTDAEYVEAPFDKGAQSYLHNAYVLGGNGMMKQVFRGKGFSLDVHALLDGRQMIIAEGPSNPASSNVSYLLERSTEKCPVYVNVIEAYREEPVIASVEASVMDGKVAVTVAEKCGRVRRLEVTL